MFAIAWPIFFLFGLVLIVFNKRLVERYIEKRPDEITTLFARGGRFLNIFAGGLLIYFSVQEFLEHPTAIPELLGF